MSMSVKLTYWKEWNKFTQRHQLERERSDREIEPETIGAEVAKEIEEMMDNQRLAGKIVVTISIGED